MRRIPFAQLTMADLRALVKLEDHGLRRQPWDDLAKIELSAEEQSAVDYVSAGLQRFQPSLVNEATVFVKAIFPLLRVVEREGVEAMADVPLSAHIGDVELAGSADAALGRAVAGELAAPFLVVMEVKRGVEGSHPVPQLYGELLVAALLNAAEFGRTSQRLHGCYTIADNWTFVELSAEKLDSPRPTLSVVSSPELNEKTQAATIAKVLKSIVAAHQRETSAPGEG